MFKNSESVNSQVYVVRCVQLSSIQSVLHFVCLPCTHVADCENLHITYKLDPDIAVPTSSMMLKEFISTPGTSGLLLKWIDLLV